MQQPGRTLAHRRYKILEPDRSSQLLGIIEELEKRGHFAALERLKKGMSDFDKSEFAAAAGDPFTAFLSYCVDNLSDSMRRLGVDEDKLQSVCVGSTLQDDVVAQISPFSDGSGLVLISDSILTLSALICRYLGSGFHNNSGSRLRAMWRAFIVARTGELGIERGHLRALLRYHNIHQRVHGKSAKLGLEWTSEESAFGLVFHLLSTKFIVAHELAHHVLGHTSPVSSFSPGEHLPVCSDGQQAELDADMLALRVLLHTREFRDNGRDEVVLPRLVMLLGALVGILTVHSVERALFIRRGSTHPSASVRIGRLLSQFSARDNRAVKVMFGGLVEAMEAAGSFVPGAEPIDLGAIDANRAIVSSMSAAYLGSVQTFDRVQCTEPAVLLGNFEAIDREIGTNMEPGARLAFSGRTVEALLSWGVSGKKVALIMDKSRALTFHCVVDAVKSGLNSLYLLNPEYVQVMSVTATTLLVEHLRES